MGNGGVIMTISVFRGTTADCEGRGSSQRGNGGSINYITYHKLSLVILGFHSNMRRLGAYYTVPVAQLVRASVL